MAYAADCVQTMTARKNPGCGTCRFFTTRDIVSDPGMCRRFPPRLSTWKTFLRRHSHGLGAIGAYPLVDPELSWCGEWQPIPPTSSPQGTTQPVRKRHKIRGSVYTVLGVAKVQASKGSLQENQDVVVYQGQNGDIWVRGVDEFNDGRFEDVHESD